MYTVNLETLKESNYPILDIDTVPESYFESALNFCIESQIEFNNVNKKFYRAISEAGNNQELITEGFSEFFEGVQNIINKFIKFIKNLFDKFIAYLMDLIKSDKYIVKNKDRFSEFDSDCEFDMDIFEYIFNKNIPLAVATVSYKEDFYDLDKPSKAQSVYANLKDKLQNNFYDEFRGTVIGKHGTMISSMDFAQELYKVYRNGDRETTKTKIDRQHVLSALDSFTNYKQAKTDVTSTKSDIEKDYNAIKDYVESAVKVKFGKIPYPVDVTTPDGDIRSGSFTGTDLNYLNLFVKAKTNQVEEMSKIHALAFAAKLDALKEQYAQDKKLLYTAIHRILKKKGDK